MVALLVVPQITADSSRLVLLMSLRVSNSSRSELFLAAHILTGVVLVLYTSTSASCTSRWMCSGTGKSCSTSLPCPASHTLKEMHQVDRSICQKPRGGQQRAGIAAEGCANLQGSTFCQPLPFHPHPWLWRKGPL
jgi:hypothetical protein